MKTHCFIMLLCTVLASFFADAREIEVEQLMESGATSLSDVPLACREDLGLLCFSDGNIIPLEGSDTVSDSWLQFPDSVVIDDFFFEGDRLVFRRDRAVVWADGTAHSDGIAFEDGDFSISQATDSTFYIIRPSDCSVIEFSMARKAAQDYYSLDEPPVAAGKFGSATVVVCHSNIYLILGDDTSVMHSHPQEIHAAAVTPAGIYFGTDSALWRVVDFDRLEHVADGSISRIVGAGDLFYVVDGTGALYKFTLLSE